MIDGAHVLTPGVLRYGMAGLDDVRAGDRRHPAVVRRSRPAGQPAGDRVRPGLRGQPVRADRVARRRLPPVRHRALHRRPRLARRPLGEQLHLRAAQAARAGRGASTRASRWRAAATRTSTSTSAWDSTPGVNVVTILGEGSFHQLHGGTTTNQLDSDGRRERIVVVCRPLRRAARPSVQGPGEDHPLRRDDVPERAPEPRPPHDRDRVPRGANDHRTRRPPDRTLADPRRADAPSSSTRSGTASRGVTRRGWDAGCTRRPPTWSSTRSSSTACGPTGSSRRVPGAVGGRCSSRRSASSSITARWSRSTAASPRTCPSTRASPTSRVPPTKRHGAAGERARRAATRTCSSSWGRPAATCG